MVKLLLAAAMLGSMVGASGGTLAAKLHTQHGKVPRVEIALGKRGPANRLSVPGIAIAAGDMLRRPFDLRNAGKTRLASVALTIRATRRSLLSSDRVRGLQLRIERCPQPWRAVPKTHGYACRGVVTHVVAPRPVIGTGIRLVRLAGLAPQRTAHLLLRLTLPSTAPNSFEGQVTSLTYTFTAA